MELRDLDLRDKIGTHKILRDKHTALPKKIWKAEGGAPTFDRRYHEVKTTWTPS